MFGLNDNSGKNYSGTAAGAGNAAALPPLSTPVANDGLSDTPPPTIDTAPPAIPASTSEPSSSNNNGPAISVATDSSKNTPATPPVGGIGDVNLENAYIPTDPPKAAKLPNATPVAAPTAASLINNSNEDELLKLKQQALQSLAPLVDHLEQSPEEKFKTTMMLIQASDNVDLIPEAYEAAGKITDEKVRAQALLDVVNEINYFTQHNAK